MNEQLDFVSQSMSVRHEANKELACLVQTKGWGYAQRVANEIQEKFKCEPTDPNWQVYTTVQYALNQLFSQCRIRAAQATQAKVPGQSILTEIKEDNASRSRGNGSSSTGRASSRRNSSRK